MSWKKLTENLICLGRCLFQGHPEAEKGRPSILPSVSPPRPYTFNHEVRVAVFEIVDSVSMRFSILNAVCMGTTYDQAWIVRSLHRHMHVCELSYMAGRVGLVGLGLFAVIDLAKNGVVIRPAGLGSRTNWKSRTTRCHAQEDDVESHQGHARFRQRIRWNASTPPVRWLDTEVLLQHNGYSHVSHEILPSWVTKTNVSMWVLHKRMVMDQQPSVCSHVTERGHVKRSYDGDCGERVRRAALGKAAPVAGSYQVGDIVSYCREARAGEHGLQWSVGSRLIGFEKDKNSLGETQSRTCWGNLPFCARMRCRRSFTSMHASGIIGFSLHAFVTCEFH